MTAAGPVSSVTEASLTSRSGNRVCEASPVDRAGVPFQSRTAADFADIAFAGLQLIAPGLVPVSEWRPETERGLIPPSAEVGYLGAAARKP